MGGTVADFCTSPRCNAKAELITIDSIRQHIIDGNAYRVCDTSFNLAADGSMNFAFIPCATKTNKVKFFIECDQSTNLRIIEDASWNMVSAANLLPAYNMNRISTNTMSCALYKSPSMSGPKWSQGTVISDTWAFALNTSGNQGRTAFGGLFDEYSLILAPGKLYLFNIVNKGNTTSANIAITMRITQGTV